MSATINAGECPVSRVQEHNGGNAMASTYDSPTGEGGYGSWAPFKAAEFRLDQSRRGRISGSKSRLRRRLYAAPNLRERRERFARGPLRKFLCSGPFLHEPGCGTVPECPGRERLFRISQ